MHAELLPALADKDAALALRAINAVKPLAFPRKMSAPLRRVALESGHREANRTAALRALSPSDHQTEETLIEVLASPASNALRRDRRRPARYSQRQPTARAASRRPSPPPRRTSRLPSRPVWPGATPAPANSSTSRPRLASGRACSATAMSVLALEKRPAAIRTRAAALTKALPPEDARLDALIAQRLDHPVTLKADVARRRAALRAALRELPPFP
jgi:hypothetical protein